MKKIFKIVIFILLTCFFAAPIFAYEDDDDDVSAREKNKNAAGVYTMGWIAPKSDSVAGLQFQHWFDNNLGFQLELGGYARKDCYYWYDYDLESHKEDEYLRSYFSAATHLLYNVFSTNQAKIFYTRFYLWGMGGVIMLSDYENSFLLNGCAGVGIGAEFVVWHRMSIPVEFGFSGSFPTDLSMSFSAATGIRFRF